MGKTELTGNNIKLGSLIPAHLTGLGTAAILNIGTTAGTVAAGDDVRLASLSLTGGNFTISSPVSNNILLNPANGFVHISGQVNISNTGTNAALTMDMQGASSSGNFIRARYSDNSVLFSMLRDGRVGINVEPGGSEEATLFVRNKSGGYPTLVVQKSSGQNANLTEWRDSSNNVISSINKDGTAAFNNLNIKSGLQIKFESNSGEFYESYIRHDGAGLKLDGNFGVKVQAGLTAGELKSNTYVLSAGAIVSGQLDFGGQTGSLKLQGCYGGPINTLLIDLALSGAIYTSNKHKFVGVFETFNSTPSSVPFSINAAPSQTANLFEAQDSSANILTTISSAGGITATSLALTGVNKLRSEDMPSRLGDIAQALEGTDLNTVFASGFYSFHPSAANKPPGYSYGMMQVLRYDSGQFTQIVYPLYASGNKSYYRYYSNSTYSAWIESLSSASIGTTAGTVAAGDHGHTTLQMGVNVQVTTPRITLVGYSDTVPLQQWGGADGVDTGIYRGLTNNQMFLTTSNYQGADFEFRGNYKFVSTLKTSGGLNVTNGLDANGGITLRLDSGLAMRASWGGQMLYANDNSIGVGDILTGLGGTTNIGLYYSSNAVLSLGSAQGNNPLLRIRGGSGQFANLFEAQNSSGNTLTTISSAGGITATSLTLTGGNKLRSEDMPLRLGELAKLIDGTDLNNLITTGFYRGNSLANRPASSISGDSDWYYITVIAHQSDWVSQEAIALSNISLGPQGRKVYRRIKDSGTWLDWVEQTQGSIGTTAGTVAAGDDARLVNAFQQGTTLIGTATGTNSKDLIYGNMADNDQFRIRIGGTGSNAGFVEIATADDGTEPIYVRQYTGVFSSLTRSATLLDESGNTNFPGTVTLNNLILSNGNKLRYVDLPTGTTTGTVAAGDDPRFGSGGASGITEAQGDVRYARLATNNTFAGNITTPNLNVTTSQNVGPYHENATGRFGLSGASAEFSLMSRNQTSFINSPTNGERWVIYSHANDFRVWSGVDKLIMTNAGNLSVVGTVTSAGLTSTGTVSLPSSGVTMGANNVLHSGNIGSTSGTVAAGDDTRIVNAATNASVALKANIASPTFTGTVSGITKSMVGLANVDNTSDATKPISTLTQTALNSKADLVGGLVPANQLPGYVDDILEYADSGAFPATGESGKIYVAQNSNLIYRWTGTTYVIVGDGGGGGALALGETSATAYRGDRGKIAYDHSQLITGNPHGTTKADLGLGNVDNTSDANKPVSTAQQTALNLKANLASPTFTGTVGGITKTMVGLGNVDNTSDASKPVSTAQQTALNLKANLASPTFTGTVSGITATMVGLGNVTNTSDANKPVSTAQQTAINLKQDKVARTTVTGTTASITNNTVENISISVGRTSHLLQLSTDVACEVRLYTTAAARTADASRPITTIPDSGIGLLFEGVTTSSNLSVPCTPSTLLFNLDGTTSSTIYASVKNTSGTTTAVTITLTKITLEN